MTYLLEAVEEQARQAGAQRVVAINLVLGARAGIDDSLLFYFNELTPGTSVEGARLNIRRTEMRFHCDACADDYHPVAARDDFGCPRCGAVGQLTYEHLSHSNTPAMLFVVDVKHNRLYHGWLTPAGSSESNATHAVRVPVQKISSDF